MDLSFIWYIIAELCRWKITELQWDWFLIDDSMDGMKNSPHNGPGTPREDMPPVSGGNEMGYNPLYGQNDPVNTVSSLL